MKKILLVGLMLIGAASLQAQQQQDTTSTSDQPSEGYRTDDSNMSDTTSTQDQPNEGYRTDDSDTSDTTSTTGQPSEGYRTDDSQSSSDVEDDPDSALDLISTTDLPAIVREQLTSSEYSGWTIEEIRTKKENGETYYKVKMQNGDQKRKVKFDAQGNVVKEKEKDTDKD